MLTISKPRNVPMARRRERGVSFVEFAFAAPVLLGLVFAILDLNDGFEHLHRVANAHFESGRALSIAAPSSAGDCSASAQALIEQALRDLPRIQSIRASAQSSSKAGVAFVDLRLQARVSCFMCAFAAALGSPAFGYDRVMSYPLESGQGCE